MKQLKKHPKQQRMEEMTFPLHKSKRNLRFVGNLYMLNPSAHKVKVIWEGREWLRSINDDNGFTLMPRLVWRVVAVVILVIICLVIIL